MSEILFTKRKFPKGSTGIFSLPVTERALIRGAIAAGQNPRSQPHAVDARADIDMKAAILRSALDFSGSTMTQTPHYKTLGPTAKGQKSFVIGNALCAHAAYRDLQIPWLVDYESLPASVFVKLAANSGKRPDFLGLDSLNRWHVFESKGRSKKPTPSELKEWGLQARRVRKVNGNSPIYRIASAAYINTFGDWDLIWEDPPSKFGDDLEFSDSGFFRQRLRIDHERVVGALAGIGRDKEWAAPTPPQFWCFGGSRL